MKLDLRRKDNTRINYKFEQSADESDKTAIFLPGFAYSTEAPLFHFLKMHLLETGWNVLSIDYRYNDNEVFLKLSDREQDQYFDDDCYLLRRELEQKIDSEQTLFIGKSLGTSVIYHLLSESDILRNNKRNSYIWITPGIMNEEICNLLLNGNLNSLYIQGEADKLYDKRLIKELKDKGAAAVLTIPDAGHSFEEKKNIRKTMDNNSQVVRFIIDELSI